MTYLFIDSNAGLNNLPNIWHNPDSVAAYEDDHNVDIDPRE